MSRRPLAARARTADVRRSCFLRSCCREHAVPLLAFTILSAGVSWPLVRDFTTRVNGFIRPDQTHAIWMMSNVQQWLLGKQDLFWAGALFYPYGTSLLVDSVGPLSGLIALPFWFWGPAAAYNGTVLVGLTLSGYCMYLLARDLGLPRSASLFAGVVLAMTPVHLAGLQGHIEKTFIGLPPLVLLGLHRGLDAKRHWCWCAATAAALLCAGLYSGYQFVYTAVAAAFVLVAIWVSAPSAERAILFRRMVVLGTSVLLLVGPLIVAAVSAARRPGVDVAVAQYSDYYSPDLTQLVLPAYFDRVFGGLARVPGWISDRPHAGSDIDVETAVTLSWAVIPLCILGLKSGGRLGRRWMLFTALFVVLALGPSLRVFGQTHFTRYGFPLPLPFGWLTRLPGLGFMRASGRFMMVGTIGLAIVASLGVEDLVRRYGKRAAITAAALVLVLVQGWPRPWPQWRPFKVPAFYEYLAGDREMYGVLDVPAFWPAGGPGVVYQFLQMTHHKGIAWGYVARGYSTHPVSAIRRLIDAQTTPGGSGVASGAQPGAWDGTQAELARLGYRYVVWHKTFGVYQATADFIDGVFGADTAPVFEDDDLRVYRVRSEAAPAASRRAGSPRRTPAAAGVFPFAVDFDADRMADLAVFRPADGTWRIERSSGGTAVIRWGAAGDLPAVADYDGNGEADIAVFRPAEGAWYFLNGAGQSAAVKWGAAGDVCVPADYDGDGKADIAVFRPAEGAWYLQNRAGSAAVTWGSIGDVPVPADYDGDGKTDLAVFRPPEGGWYILKSTGGSAAVKWGAAGDVPVPADYDGDGKADVGVFRPTDGVWYILKSTGGSIAAKWGLPGDIPVPADHDGDGKADFAVFREPPGTWSVEKGAGGRIGDFWPDAGDRLK